MSGPISDMRSRLAMRSTDPASVISQVPSKSSYSNAMPCPRRQLTGPEHPNPAPSRAPCPGPAPAGRAMSWVRTKPRPRWAVSPRVDIDVRTHKQPAHVALDDPFADAGRLVSSATSQNGLLPTHLTACRGDSADGRMLRPPALAEPACSQCHFAALAAGTGGQISTPRP